ncbi:hypothetical protein [Nostoc phage Nsp-JY21]
MIALILSHIIAFVAGTVIGIAGLYALAAFLCPTRRLARIQRANRAQQKS